jgi:hypothetical protein
MLELVLVLYAARGLFVFQFIFAAAAACCCCCY